MSTLLLRKISRGRITVERRQETGALVATATSTFNDASHYRKASRSLGLTESDLIARIDAFKRDDCEERSLPITLQQQGTFAILIRGIREPSSAGETISHAEPLRAFRAAIERSELSCPEPVLHWQTDDRLACVDIDFHRLPFNARPTESQLNAIAEMIRPRPVCHWSTHGRGLRLVYVEKQGFTAAELAAVACLHFTSSEPTARAEVKRETRHPGYARGSQRCGSVVWHTGNCDLGEIATWLGEYRVSNPEVDGWLSARGLERGKRYSHSRCPARPEESAGRDPVEVRDSGIWCHACHGRGVTRGSRIPGFFPFAVLAGRAIESTLSRCISRFTHYEHARFVLEATTGLSGRVAELAYGACLKVKHGAEDPRVKAVFCAGERLIRVGRTWATLAGELYTKDIRNLLASLPAAQYVADDGQIRPSPAKIARLDQPIDLAEEGYPSLQQIYGVKIYGEHLPYRNPTVIPVVVQTPVLTPRAMESLRPRYLPSDPGAIESAWRVLERICPGVNRDLIRLLIAARGCAEGEQGLPPMIFVSGPTSAAKTASIHLAAAIVGDNPSEVIWSPNIDRVRQALLEAKGSGTFAVFNEFLKDSGRGGESSVSAMDFILNLTPNSVSHKLYVGPVPLGTLPVCVWTDTTIPAALRQSAQIARRIVGVELHRSLEWQSSLREAGISRVVHARVQSSEFAEAGNHILSEVIDRFFRAPTEFSAIAAELGFGVLRDSEESHESEDTLRRFFNLLCKTPDVNSSLYKGRGWKRIDPYGETDLQVIWRALADANGLESRKIAEQDWGKLLGVKAPVEWECRSHGKTVYGRFLVRESRKSYRVNLEITDGLQPETEEVDRWEAMNSILAGLTKVFNGISDS